MSQHEFKHGHFLLSGPAFVSWNLVIIISESMEGDAFVFLSHVKFSPRKGAKFGSSDKVYCMLCFQLSKEVTVSVLLRDHCFGARCVEAILKGDGKKYKVSVITQL